ncbi:MAG TPA: immunoglobulin domain-containing protein, partial [Candidatus Cybelea sp.]|nr:immunoglobulin domain-containing protein [Candidatus Cybelea sp.]
WPNETSDMQWIAQYGIPVMASDLFDNGSVYSGVTTPISVPPIPPTPPLQNKVYVSITLSDGDNVQYMQHTMKTNWESTARGSVPIGWTVQPLLADFDPGMLNYFWSTATTNDCLVAGPSGAGYTRINYWSAGNVASITRASNPYLQKTGIRTITVWLTISNATGNAYAANCPTLVGVNDQSDGYYATNDGTLPVIGFPSSGNYATNVANLLNAITNTAAGWKSSSPMFIAVQARSWGVTPANCQTVVNSLDPSEYVVVRPDQLFLLYQKSAGLSQGGAVPYVATQPMSQLASAGTNVTFNVIASGTAPLIYQWRMNGTNIPGATNSTYTRSNVQLSDTGSYQVIVANTYGFVTSSAAMLTFGNQPLGFNGNGLNWTVNQNSNYFVYSTPAISNNLLTLTDGGGSEAQSFFFNQPQYIGAFKAAFTYQAGGNEAADGVSFCLQNDPRGITALGGSGGQLGVGTTNPITPSIELELNLYTGGGQSMGYTVLTNGLTGSGGGNGNYNAPGNINFKSGDPINITVNYANGQMALTFTDTVVSASFTTNLNVGDLTQILGTNAAYVGFTGSDGGSTSIQTIRNFSFVSIPAAAIRANGANLLISWPGTSPGFILQQNSSIAATNWVNVTNQGVLVNGMNQVMLTEGAGNQFFRLILSPP